MGGTRRELDQEGLVRRERADAVDVVDRLVGHRGHQIPAGLADVRIDRRGIADEIAWLPLIGIAAHEAVKIFKAYAGRPLIERSGLARLVFRSIVVLAEPRGVVAIVPEDASNRGLVLGDDAVIARIAGRLFGNDTVASRMMIAAGDQCRTGRRTQRRRMEVGITQAVLRDPIERRGRDHSAERRRHAVAGIVGDDQKNVRRAFGRNDTRRPKWCRLRRIALDLATEFLRRWWKLIPGNGDGCGRRARRRRGRLRLLCKRRDG
ncbi:hypothetical protein ACVMGC_006714 [Bradyrhizobium barranii subsp. barranii]